MKMKCKVIKVTFDVGLTNYKLLEDTVNIWLKSNTEIKILFITQAGLDTKTIVTTIFYD